MFDKGPALNTSVGHYSVTVAEPHTGQGYYRMFFHTSTDTYLYNTSDPLEILLEQSLPCHGVKYRSILLAALIKARAPKAVRNQ